MKVSRFSIFAALVLILAGICMTLDSLGILGINFTWWPLILIALGLYLIITRGFSFGKGLPLLLGLWFLIDTNNLISNEYDDLFLAAIIIYAGGCLLWRAFVPYKPHNHVFVDGKEYSTSGSNATFSDSHAFSDDDYVRLSSTFASNHVNCSSKNLSGGNMTVSFGELVVDMTAVAINPSGTTIDVSVAFGEGRIIVPKDVIVHILGTPFLGSINNQAFNRTPGLPILTIRASVSFGELKVIQ